MAIKGVLFDYGNVLCAPQLSSDVEAMAARSGLSLEKFKILYWQLRDQYDLADINGTQYWTKVAERGGISLDDQDIKDLILLDAQSWARPNLTMTTWVQILRENGFAVGIISNMPPELKEHIVKEPWLPKFDHYTFSCDVRSVKPAAEIYDHCLHGLGLKSDEAIFLDDRLMNIEAGQQLGIVGLVFTTAEELAPRLVARGLPPLPLAPIL